MVMVDAVLFGQHVLDGIDGKTQLEHDAEGVVLVRVLDVVDGNRRARHGLHSARDRVQCLVDGGQDRVVHDVLFGNFGTMRDEGTDGRRDGGEECVWVGVWVWEDGWMDLG